MFKLKIHGKEELFVNDGHLIHGIFGIDSDADKMKEAQTRLDEGGMDDVDFSKMDGALIANLIKLWFGMLPRRILEDVDAERMLKCRNMKQSGDMIESEMGEPYESYYDRERVPRGHGHGDGDGLRG